MQFFENNTELNELLNKASWLKSLIPSYTWEESRKGCVDELKITTLFNDQSAANEVLKSLNALYPQLSDVFNVQPSTQKGCYRVIANLNRIPYLLVQEKNDGFKKAK